VPDATVLRLYVDDEPLFVATARMAQYAPRGKYRPLKSFRSR
jgi:hypothetical protein